jgi:predicted phosphodiesterase
MSELGVLHGTLLVFGGPYGNLQATRALRAEAARLRIPPDRIICTGDVVAYCGDPAATVREVRAWGCHVVMGNCEESLGWDADDCGCGFNPGSSCDLLSRRWYDHARTTLDNEQKAWMRRLPRRLTFTWGGRRVAVIHGGSAEISRFIFPSTPAKQKREEADLLGADLVIAGHSGIPFTERLAGWRLWHNPGVLGLPPNDGTPGVFYAILEEGIEGPQLSHHRLPYDHAAAAASIREHDLPEDYAVALETGLWPSSDILPDQERSRMGRPIETAKMTITYSFRGDRWHRQDVVVAQHVPQRNA